MTSTAIEVVQYVHLLPRAPAMHLRHLLLPCLDLDLSLRFYRDVLQLPQHGNAISIGWSTLECVQAQQPVGSVHLAFNVAPSRFEAAAQWIGARATLLADPQGRRQFELGASGSRSRCISPAPTGRCWN